MGAQRNGTAVALFDPMTASRAQWDRFHAYRRARHEEAWPDDPLYSDQETEEDERDPDPHGDSVQWVAVNQNDIVGSAYSYLRHPDSPGFAEGARFLHAYGAVLKPWRGRGIGTRLLAQIHKLMLAHGKTLLTLSTEEPDGHGFLRHIGASEKTRLKIACSSKKSTGRPASAGKPPRWHPLPVRASNITARASAATSTRC